MSFRRWNWVLLFLLLGGAAGVGAQTASPPQSGAPLLLRILAYDRPMERRPGSARAFPGAPVQSIGQLRELEEVNAHTLAGRPQIYANLTAARASGADLTAALLKLATVIK